ncbi:nitroreductase family protein, partial [Desulfosarcina cetonica]|uniref:nitroreductase family protein n=1 Tax=Desulfosarcina cetonica TaxID=90730 RepID=UPI0006D1BCB6
CPKDILVLVDGQAVVREGESMGCDHCGAACPADAVEVPAVTSDLFAFKTFRADRRWLPHGRFDLPALVSLMGSRRSCRNFLSRPVERAILTDLVQVGVTAPSGTNCQPWTFTLLPHRDDLERLGRRVGDFFRRTNRMAEKAWLRRGLRLLGRPELDTYYRQYHATVKRGLEAYAAGGRDLLFHGAPAGIVVAAKSDASCPAEDALLATGNILLAAHAMGLGSCLIGYAIEAMRRDRRIVRSLGIPDHETPYAVISLGWPDETYQRVAWRKPVTIRYADR